MSKPIIKHRIKVWIITWPKGTTESWQEEPNGPTNYLPIGIDPQNRFTYFDKKEKRRIYGSPVAVFFKQEEAFAYEAAEGSEFIIRPGYLEVL